MSIDLKTRFTAWKNYDTLVYRVPLTQKITKFVCFNLSDIIIPVSRRLTGSLEQNEFIKNSIYLKHKFFGVGPLFMSLPIAQCLIKNDGDTSKCGQFDEQGWVWKTDLVVKKLKEFVDQGFQILIYTTVGIPVLKLTYSLTNVLDQVILKLGLDVWIFASIGLDSVDKILSTFSSIFQVPLDNLIIDATNELPSQPLPTYPKHDSEFNRELIVTVGTKTSGFQTYEFPNLYLKFNSPVKLEELQREINKSFVILGTHLTFSERALYIKYGSHLGIPVRLFWFAKAAWTDEFDIPNSFDEGVEIVRVN